MNMVRHDSITPEKGLHSRLAVWARQLDLLDLNEDNLSATTWENQWNRTWAEYDELEKIRIAGGFARLTWQNGMERRRKQYEDLRNWKSKSTTLERKDWSQVPLGVILEKHLGRPVCIGQCDVARALERWYEFRKVIEEQPDFEHSLSFTQQTSWTLLIHWWSANYQDPGLSKAAIALLEAAKASSQKLKCFHGELHPGQETFAKSRKSVYNSMMYNLFNREFNPSYWSEILEELELLKLRIMRRKSNLHAIAQRIAYTSYASIEQLNVPSLGSYTATTDQACPWLARGDENKEYPYYLWDVQQKRTVIAKDLPVEPEYCCVSHTWGRWRMNDIFIEGVPWLVPRNRRFNVESLPERLQRIRPRTPFIWIDLFCIPQDRSLKAKEEINRQAAIFQNASRCIAWINDVNEWTNTTKALDWIGISYLHATTSSGIYETQKLLNTLYNEAEDDSELFTQKIELAEGVKLILNEPKPQPVLAIGERKLAEPACWFPSLWTLQEAMLCPNLTFVSRDWIDLEDRSGSPISLAAFFKLIDALGAVWDNDKPYQTWTHDSIEKYSSHVGPSQSEKWPNGARQLFYLDLATRMSNLLDSQQPAGLLMAANTRQSTSNRAPAIMSALGVTGWYNPNDNTHTKEDLVLNCYPIAFVHEAAAKLGGSFYITGGGMVKSSDEVDSLSPLTKGSMLPFSARCGWFAKLKEPPNSHGIFEDHPAVKTWNIKQDGSVKIQKVGILASTERPKNDESWLRVFYFGDEPTRFIDWVNNLPKSMCLYAVSVLKYLGCQWGLFLQGYPKPWYSSTQCLVKVGIFATVDLDFPPTTDVRWLIW